MFDCVIKMLERFQTFFVGLLGFAGVIFTIVMNARLARQQHKREINHECTALRAALIAELDCLRQNYEDKIKQLQEGEKGHWALVPEYVPNQIYSQLITRIGLLTAKEIENVIDAYLLAAELPVRLKLLTKDTPEYPEYIQLSDEQAEVAAKMHESFLPKINMALASLRNEYKKRPHNE